MKVVDVLRRSGVVSLIVFIGAIFAFGDTSAAQSDPEVGTWQLNVAKSKYDPGPAPKSSTVIIEAAGKGTKVTAKGLDAAGNATGTQYTATYDGKDAPITLIGSQDYDAIALKRIDARRIEGTRKKGGTAVQTYVRVISEDGKTMTITSIGTNAKGQKVNNVAVYEKQ